MQEAHREQISSSGSTLSEGRTPISPWSRVKDRSWLSDRCAGEVTSGSGAPCCMGWGCGAARGCLLVVFGSMQGMQDVGSGIALSRLAPKEM